MEDGGHGEVFESTRYKSGGDWLPIMLGIGFLGFLAFLAFMAVSKNSSSMIATPSIQTPLYVAVPPSLKGQ